MLGFSPLATTPLGTSSHNEAFTLVAQSGTYAVSTQGVGKLITDVYPSGSYTLNGRAISFGIGYAPMPLDAGAFTVTGQNILFSYGQGIVFDTGTYTITTNDVDLNVGIYLLAENGTFTLTGQDIATPLDVSLILDNGEFELTSEELERLGVDYKIIAASGTFAITFQDAERVGANYKIIVNSSIMTITGNDVKFRGFFTPFTPPETWTTQTDVSPEIWTEAA